MGNTLGYLAVFRLTVDRPNPNRFSRGIFSDAPSVVGIDVDFHASYTSPAPFIRVGQTNEMLVHQS
jgi:hypothetical protein